MSSSVNPNGTLVSRCDATQYTIVSSTATSPIVITLNAAALTGVGDYVEVTGHLVNTGANGKWQVTNVAGGGTQITLGGTTGTLAGGATGYMRDFSVNPQITIPSTGDAATAASVGTPMSAQIAPAIPWLLQRMGNWRLHSDTEFALYVPPDDTSGSFNHQWISVLTTPPTATQFGSPFPLVVPDVPMGEIVLVDFRMTALFQSSAGLAAIYPIIAAGSGGYVLYRQNGIVLPFAATNPYCVAFSQLVPMPTGSSFGPITINWNLIGLASPSGSNCYGIGPAAATVRVYRQ